MFAVQLRNLFKIVKKKLKSVFKQINAEDVCNNSNTY